MEQRPRQFYEFEAFRIDVRERALLSNDRRVPLTPKVFDVLLALVENCGHTLTKDELIERVWTGSFVEEGSLNRNVSTLRKVLGDDVADPRFIKTTPKRGYSFVGEVSEVWETDETVTVENRTRYHLKVSEHVTREAARTNWRVRIAAGLVAVVAVAALAWVWNQTQQRKARSVASLSDSAEAVELYERGRALWQTRDGVKLHEATVALEQAVEKDPNFALAHAALADAYAFDYLNWKKADAAARDAISLDPSLGRPYATIGFVRMFWEWRFDAAERELKEAMRLDPGYATAHQWYAVLLQAAGRYDAAFSEIKQAADLEPESEAINADLCQTLYHLRRFDEAIAQCRRTLAMDGSNFSANRYLYEIYATIGEADLAVRQHFRLEELGSSTSAAAADGRLEASYQKGGIRGFWSTRLDELGAAHYQAAQTLARLGENDLALEKLYEARDKRDPDFLFFYADPAFGALHHDRRFEKLLVTFYPPRE